MGAMTAKPADRFEHLTVAKHRWAAAVRPGDRSPVRIFLLVRNRGLVGKDMAAGGAGQFLACALESRVYGFTP